MNWDALGAVAETIGAIAVISSLAYLAAQVRQTKLQLQAQSEDNMISRAFDAYAPLYEGNNAAIFRKGLENPEALDTDEAFIFKLLMDRQRGAFGTIVRRKHTGTTSRDLTERHLDGFRNLFLNTEGGRQWLEQARHQMSTYELSELDIKDRNSHDSR